MMTAQECRSRADALEALAAMEGARAQMLQLSARAQEWRNLSDVADWQDAILAALATSGGRVS